MLLPAVVFAEPGSLSSANTIPGFKIQSNQQIAKAGNFHLSWEVKSDKKCPECEFTLEESEHPDFQINRVLYRGTDRAATISGKTNGTYYYRVRISNHQDSARQGISPVIKVIVEHHSLNYAIMFFLAGAFVFLSTLFVMFRPGATS